MADLPGWLVYNPWIHHGDPGPEIYQVIASLPPEQQGPIVSAISSARSELESVRAKGYAQIGERQGSRCQTLSENRR